jgi:hypothetical protein
LVDFSLVLASQHSLASAIVAMMSIRRHDAFVSGMVNQDGAGHRAFWSSYETLKISSTAVRFDATVSIFASGFFQTAQLSSQLYKSMFPPDPSDSTLGSLGIAEQRLTVKRVVGQL